MRHSFGRTALLLSGGAASGYYRINANLISTKSTIFDESTFLVYNESTTFSHNQSPATKLSLKVVEQDYFGKDLTVRLEQIYDISSFNNSLRFKSTVEDYSLIEYVLFQHTREGSADSINSDQFTGVPDTLPLYYVVTSVYYDPYTGREVESAFSQEVLAAPLVIDTNLRELPGRNQFQVVTDYTRAIMRVNTDISLIPGSTTRDVSIDPFSSEAERLYFLVDFVHKAQSFTTLLQMDDASGSGVSDPVASSAYKIALKAAVGYSTDDAVQALIDASFDKLAANVGKKRLPGRPAVGLVTYYTTTRPTFNIPVPAGSIVSTSSSSNVSVPAVSYRVGGSYVMVASQADAYYNFDTKRYEVVVDVVANQVGSDGNRPAGQITTSSGVSGLSVTNTSATVFGSDRESNADLAARSILGFVSVDTGTEGGYTSTSAAQVGIVKAKVVKSGDDLMMRDYDEVRHKHIGGKVDIWVQGLRERQVTETFAFTFEIARDIQCLILDATNLVFRVQDSRVTVNTPITEILDNLPQGLGVRNVTQGLDYLLTGAQILDYQTFKLDPMLLNQVVTSVDDVISADYRFRILNQFQFTFQPVRRVVSVVGEVSGSLDSALGYNLYKTADPLLDGESTISNDNLSINQIGGVPSGLSIPVNNEAHVLIGFQSEPLGSIGINTKTIRVFSVDRTKEYSGPDTANPDYEVLSGTPTTPAKIVRTTDSIIANGVSVSVDYSHDENFVVTYVINDLLQQLQRTINGNKHITADVVVKEAIENLMDIETTVQLLPGASRDNVDPAIRSNVSSETNSRLIGQGIAQSDVVKIIDSTPGVDFEVLPLAKMAYSDGSRKLREVLTSVYTALPTLDIAGNVAYILTTELEFPTTDGGGLTTEHKGVFQDDESLALSTTLALVAKLPNQAFIIGASGAIIEGYTDTTTLINAGYVTVADQQKELLKRTANHIVVSLSGAGVPADTPLNHTYAVSYVIRGDSGSKDITASGVEFVSLGNFVITFRSV